MYLLSVNYYFTYIKNYMKSWSVWIKNALLHILCWTNLVICTTEVFALERTFIAIDVIETIKLKRIETLVLWMLNDEKSRLRMTLFDSKITVLHHDSLVEYSDIEWKNILKKERNSAGWKNYQKLKHSENKFKRWKYKMRLSVTLSLSIITCI